MSTPIAQLAIALDASEAQVKFGLLAGRFEDFSPVLGGAVLTELRDMEKGVFDSEGASIGPKWPPLAPSTIRERVRLGYGVGPILRRTSRLRDSVAKDRKTGDSIVDVTPFGLQFGSRVPYADAHQQTRGGRRMPRRAFLPDPLPVSVLAAIRQHIRNFLIEGRIRSATR